jgi:hypothetical protein
MKWYSYPVSHGETSRMASSLEHILELLPLQNHVDRQLFTNRVPVVLEVPGVRILILSFSHPSACILVLILQASFQIGPSHRRSSLDTTRRQRWPHICDCIKTVDLFLFSKFYNVAHAINSFPPFQTIYR